MKPKINVEAASRIDDPKVFHYLINEINQVHHMACGFKAELDDKFIELKKEVMELKDELNLIKQRRTEQ